MSKEKREQKKMEAKKKMNNAFIYIAILVGLLAIPSMIILIANSTGTTFIGGEGETQYIFSELEKQYTPDAWTVEGDKVYIDTAQAYISAQPHTSNYGWVTYNITPKQYTGDIDIVFGFDTNEITPTKARWKPVKWNKTIEYVCEKEFNYTTSPKHFWCYETVVQANGTYVRTIFQHDFISGDIPSKTASWYELETNYTDISGAFDKRTVEFKGMNKWFFKNNFSVTAGESYVFQIYLLPKGITTGEHKYWFATKPSSKTFEEAIDTNTLYALDPWTAALSANLTGYFKLDDPLDIAVSNITTESVYEKNLTLFKNAVMRAGLINTGGNFTSANQSMLMGEVDHWFALGGNPWSVSVWVYPHSVAGQNLIAISQSNWVLKLDGDEMSIATWNNVSNSWASDRDTLARNIVVGRWYHLVATYNGSNAGMIFYVNATEWDQTGPWQTGSVPSTGVGVPGQFRIGGDNYSNDWANTIDCDCLIDELGIWNRTLSQGEIDALYNSGAGIQYSAQLTVNITYPIAIVYNTSVTQLNYTVDAGADKCWYSVDNGTTNATSVTAGDLFTVTAQPNTNYWNVFCNDTSSNVFSDNVAFIVNKSVGNSYNAPADAYKTNDYFVVINWTNTVVNTNLTNTTLRVWRTNGTLAKLTTTILSGTTAVNTVINETTLFTDDEYIWNVETCGDEVSCTTGVNRTFGIDFDSPNLTINNPNGVLGAVQNGTSLLFNWTLSEAGEVLSNHISSCNYTYNQITTPINLSYCVNVTSFSLTYVSGVDTLNMSVSDFYGNVNETRSTWVVTLSEINQTYASPVVEGSTQEFTIWIVGSPTYTVSAASLNYNGTVTAGTLVNPSGDTYKASISFIVPVVSVDTVVDFKWTFTLNDSTIVNSNTNNQTITNLTIDSCGSQSNVLLNFTIANELSEVRLNETSTLAKLNLQILDSSHTTVLVSFNNSYTQINPFGVCLNTNLTGSSLTYDMQLEYSATNHSIEFYHFQNQTLNNTSFSTNITLLDLNLTNAQIFQISYKDASFLAVTDALIKVQRKYINQNLFKTSEIAKTDTAGDTLASLEVDDVIYNIIVLKNNVILDTFNNIRVSCQNPTIQQCTLPLNSFRGALVTTDFEEELDLSYTLSHDRTTRLVTFVYSVPSGTSSLFLLNVTKNDALGTSACTNTLTSSAGTISCTIPASIGNTTVSARVYRDGNLSIHSDFNLQQLPSELYGTVAVILALFIMLTLIGAGMSDNAIFTVIFFLVGVILLYALNLVANNGFIGGSATILWLIIAIILIIVKGGKRD